jgi:glycosyltransferase involved in cell wall biosynthesis
MRIAVCNTFGRFLGGVESYLGRLIPSLASNSHELALLFETDAPASLPRLPATERVWFASEIGTSQMLRELRHWRPDIIYIHAISDADLEWTLLETAPAVLFAHDYAATCISGAKTFSFPRPRCCSRQLGIGCLVNYFPRRCGGLSPITMWQDYQSRLARLAVMRRYHRVLVASEAMRREYLRHAFEPSRVEVAPYPVMPTAAEIDGGETSAGRIRSEGVQFRRASPVHLLFVGRMVQLKGGEILIRALPQIAQRLQVPLKLTLAGDGPAKSQWEAQARFVCAGNSLITTAFTGWLDQANLQRLISECDLLVVPSLWPEPFGMIGPEAGCAGLPAVAFAVGGVPEWLHDGINGFLAPANPPSTAGLAAAIAQSLADPALHRQLREGAQREAAKFSIKRHVEKLLEIFTRAVAEDVDRIERSVTASLQERNAALLNPLPPSLT